MARFVPDIDGYRELMKSAAMQKMVTQAAESMASDANSMASSDQMDREPFSSRSGVDEVAAYAFAFTNSPHGRNAEASKKYLTKAFKSIRAG